MKRIVNLACVFILVLFSQVQVRAALLDSLNISSSYMNRDIEVLLIQPSKVELKELPLVFLLHGYGGSQLQWLEIKPNLPELADSLGMIFVCPDACNSWYWDSPLQEDSQYESFFIQELIPYLSKQRGLVCSTETTAIAGLSMGGHGALWYASRYPDLFGAVGSMSGGVDLREFPEGWNLKEHLGSLAENLQVWEKHTVAASLSELLKSEQAVIIDCGVDDFFYSVNVKLHEDLVKHKIPHDFIVRPGAHNRAYWNNAIDYQLLFFKNYFNRK